MAGEFTQAGALAHRPVGPVDHERSAEARRVRGDGEQHVVGLGGREAECDHSDIDATRIHGAEEIGEGGRGTDVAAEQIGNALIAGASPRRPRRPRRSAR